MAIAWSYNTSKYVPSGQSIDQSTTRLKESPSKRAWDFDVYFCGSLSTERRMLPIDVSSPFGIDRHQHVARQPAPGLILNEKTSTPITVWPRQKWRKYILPYHRPLMIRAASMKQFNARGCRTTIVGVPGVMIATPVQLARQLVHDLGVIIDISK